MNPHDVPSLDGSPLRLLLSLLPLLIILIGGVGTLSGALVGAVIYRLLDFGLRRYIGESASFISGAVYVLFVLFIPFGIVGTWKMKSVQIKEGWQRLQKLFG